MKPHLIQAYNKKSKHWHRWTHIALTAIKNIEEAKRAGFDGKLAKYDQR